MAFALSALGQSYKLNVFTTNAPSAVTNAARAMTRSNDFVGSFTGNGAGLTNISRTNITERINVMEFGLVQDSSVDNWGPLQAAFNSGMKLFIPPGDYRVNQTLHVTNNLLNVSGISATIRPGAQMTNVLEVVTPVASYDFVWDGVSIANQYGVSVCVATNGMVLGSSDGTGAIIGGRIERAQFQWFRDGTGVIINSAQSLHLKDVSVSLSQIGIEIAKPSSPVYAYNVTFDHCFLNGNYTNGVYVNNGLGISFNNCFIQGSGGPGIRVANGLYGGVAGPITVSDCFFDGNCSYSQQWTNSGQFHVEDAFIAGTWAQNITVQHTFFSGEQLSETNFCHIRCGPGTYSLINNSFTAPVMTNILCSSNATVTIRGWDSGHPSGATVVTPNLLFGTSLSPLVNVHWEHYGYDGISGQPLQRWMNLGNGTLSLLDEPLTNRETRAVFFSNNVSTVGGKIGVGVANPAWPLQVYNGSSLQSVFHGYAPLQGYAQTFDGSIAIGSNAAFQGVLQYDATATPTRLCLDSTYDDASSLIVFRMRTAGTPISALSINGSGAVSAATTFTATNSFMLPTNYVAANFTPVAGMVKIVSSNGVLFKVTQLSTNLLSQDIP